MNHKPEEKRYYSLDNDLFRRQWYPPVEQLGRDVSFYAWRRWEERGRRTSVYWFGTDAHFSKVESPRTSWYLPPNNPINQINCIPLFIVCIGLASEKGDGEFPIILKRRLVDKNRRCDGKQNNCRPPLILVVSLRQSKDLYCSISGLEQKQKAIGVSKKL